MKLSVKNTVILLTQQRVSTLNGLIICHPKRMCMKTHGNGIMNSDADV